MTDMPPTANNNPPEGTPQPGAAVDKGQAEMMPPGGSKRTGMWIGLVVVAVAVIGGAWWLLKPAPKAAVTQKTYKVGLMTIDGFLQSNSTALKQGVELAQKLLKNDAVNVDIVMKATDCDSKEAAKAMQEFVDAGVVAVVGEFCSDATLGAAPIANAHHIPLISPASTSPKLTTQGGDYVYRTVPSDALEAVAIAEAMYNKYKIRKLAIMHSDDSYGTGVRDVLKASFEKLGGKVVSDEDDTKNQTDVTPELMRAKASNPDGFFLVGVELNEPILLKKKEIGFTVPAFGPEYFKDPQVVSGAEGAVEGLVLASPSDGTKSFSEKFRASYNADPGPYSAQAYDALEAIMDSLKDGATTGATIKAKLDTISFNGASGRIKFDGNGDVGGNYSLFVIKSGKAIPVE